MLCQVDLIDFFLPKTERRNSIRTYLLSLLQTIGSKYHENDWLKWYRNRNRNLLNCAYLKRAALTLNDLWTALMYLNYLIKDRILCPWNVLDFSSALTDTACIRHFVTIRTVARIWTIIVSTRLSCNTGITQALIDI